MKLPLWIRYPNPALATGAVCLIGAALIVGVDALVKADKAVFGSVPPVSTNVIRVTNTTPIEIFDAEFHKWEEYENQEDKRITELARQAWEQGFMWGATFGMRYHTNATNVLDGLTNNPIK